MVIVVVHLRFILFCRSSICVTFSLYFPSASIFLLGVLTVAIAFHLPLWLQFRINHTVDYASAGTMQQLYSADSLAQQFRARASHDFSETTRQQSKGIL